MTKEEKKNLWKATKQIVWEELKAGIPSVISHVCCYQLERSIPLDDALPMQSPVKNIGDDAKNAHDPKVLVYIR